MTEPRTAIELFVDRLLDRSVLADEEIDALLGLKGRTSHAHAHVDIVFPGEVADHACLIVEGLAGRFGQVLDGRRQITALHIAGDMCDLHSVVTPRVSWALQALSPTTILQIPLHALRDVARAHRGIAEAFWRDCSVDASILSQWIVNVSRLNARSRLAHLLCEMAVRTERAGLGSRHDFALEASQPQLGDALGLTAVHVNRTFQALRRENVVETAGRQIRIVDWDRLAAIADFDETYLQVESTKRGTTYRAESAARQ